MEKILIVGEPASGKTKLLREFNNSKRNVIIELDEFDRDLVNSIDSTKTKLEQFFVVIRKLNNIEDIEGFDRIYFLTITDEYIVDLLKLKQSLDRKVVVVAKDNVPYHGKLEKILDIGRNRGISVIFSSTETTNIVSHYS